MTRVINVAYLRKVLEYITANRSEWRQAYFACRTSCGTAACLAGHAVLLAGHELRFDAQGFAWTTEENDSISTLATRLLGLDILQADRLFKGNNSLLDLWESAADFTNGEIEVPLDVRESEDPARVGQCYDD
jgi:hypothetical protein